MKTKPKAAPKGAALKASFVDMGKPARWKKGQSGNPNGRPRTAKFSEAVRQISLEIDPKTGLTGAERLARYAMKRALRGSARHMEFCLGYTEGKPGQRLEISGADGAPFELAHLSLADLEARALKVITGILGNPADVAGAKIRESLLAEKPQDTSASSMENKARTRVSLAITEPQEAPTAPQSIAAAIPAQTPEQERNAAIGHYLMHPRPQRDCPGCEERYKRALKSYRA